MADVSIVYCKPCGYEKRASDTAAALKDRLNVAAELVPGTGGIFTISCNDVLVWDRKRDGGFPDAAKLKQLVRDVIDPDRDLGHADRKGQSSKDPA